jgi:hypothetical protein
MIRQLGDGSMPLDEIKGKKVIWRCDCCGSKFQMGQGRYEGTGIEELNGTFCRACFPENRFSVVEFQKGVDRLRALLAR